MNINRKIAEIERQTTIEKVKVDTRVYKEREVEKKSSTEEYFDFCHDLSNECINNYNNIFWKMVKKMRIMGRRELLGKMKWKSVRKLEMKHNLICVFIQDKKKKKKRCVMYMGIKKKKINLLQCTNDIISLVNLRYKMPS